MTMRGLDTRSGFTDYLYTSLTNVGIRTFKDDKDLHIGEEFAPELLEAINHSRISIPIFSKDYASSIWCLKELVQMVKHQTNEGQKIMPIFYDVTPSEVRHQIGSFKKALVSHKTKGRYDEKTIAEWKNALTTVADVNGWDLQSMPNRQEGQLAKTITQKVFNELKKAYLVVSNNLVNMDDHVGKIMEQIGAQTSETRIIGIHGMGGIGKTTIAKIIYNQLLEKFEGCCFLSSIREMSERKGIESLQNQLISDILKDKCTDIRNIDDGINTIKARLSNKRVLLLLDDVHEKNHSDALVGERDWFGKGSIIIITTRNKEVLDVLKVDSCYELSGMDHDQSLQLFSKHAFRRDHPLDEYIDQSERAIKIAGGLPLALELMGSLLSCTTEKKKWDFELRKWESDPHKDVQSRLKISYDELEEKEKQKFLDIACLLIGYDKDIVVHFWEFEFHPEYAMDVLENMSLVKIKEDNKVWMHDQLRDLGRQIVCQETNINKQSRVWDREKALDLLKSPKTKKKVEALRLRLDHQHGFTYNDFKSLSRLRFLEVDDSEQTFCVEKMLLQHKGPSSVLPTDVLDSNLLPEVRWLSWHNIHPTFEIANFSVENLTILDLSRSEITHDWKGWSHMKGIKNLKVLNLAHCQCLERTPNFFAHLNLEHLILSGCESLIEIDESICQLKRLIFLDVSNCWNLQRLPKMVRNLDLLTLDISHTSIEEVPDSIGMSKNLKVMKMQNGFENRTNNDACKKMGKVKGMEIADRYNHVTHAHAISGYCLYGRSWEKILGWPGVHALPRFPESLIELVVEELRVDTFPDLSNLANLKVLHLGFGPPNCDGKSYGLLEKRIPWWIGNLSKLESLLLCFFGGTASSIDLSLPPHPPLLLRLPSSLSVLRLSGCDSLGSMDLSNLRKLSDLDICCSAVAKIEGLGCLENLRDFRLRDVVQLAMLPDLSKLNKLRRITVSGCCNLVEIQGELPRFLDELKIGSRDSLQKFPDPFSIMGKTHVYVYVHSGNQVFEYLSGNRLQLSGIKQMQIPNLSNMDGITLLRVESCHNLVEIQGKLPQSLKTLYIESCGNLVEIQGELPQSLETLDIDSCGSLVEIQNELPQSLETLRIKWCGSLQKLPELSSLKRLRWVTIKGLNIQIPDLSNMDGIRYLSVEYCRNLVEIELPQSLEYLNIESCGNLVEIQGELPQSLKTLWIQ
ncbi:hypothetical protein EUGRSUZ_H03735, partial [Eucalyptus grandis]